MKWSDHQKSITRSLHLVLGLVLCLSRVGYFLETDVSRENDVTHYFDTIGVLSCGRIFWKVAGEINQITSKHLTGHSL